MKKRSQVTVFIILGILLVFLFVFFFYVASNVGHKKLKSQGEEINAVLSTSSDLDYFLSSCINEAAKDGVSMVALSGGFVQEDYPGKLANFALPSVNYFYPFMNRNYTVTYQVLETNFSKEGISTTDIYPCWDFNSTAAYSRIPVFMFGQQCKLNYSHDFASYGFNTVPPNFIFGRTNSYRGKEIRPGLCKSSQKDGSGFYSCTCMPNGVDCKYSVQAQLESYIAFRIEECSDLSSFERSLGARIDKGNISVNVTIGNNDVSVNVDFPITVALLDETAASAKTAVKSFNSVVPIKLKAIYSLIQGEGVIPSRNSSVSRSISRAQSLVYRDINNISFDIVNDGYDLASSYGYGELHIEREFLPSGDSIIRLTDPGSMVDGRNFSIQFARQNRRPALDYLRLNTLYGEYGNSYDVYVYESKPFVLSPVAYDPDEDDIVYRYSGWKAESPETNFWERSDIYLDGNTTIDKCNHPFYGLTKRRCASYRASHDDLGWHTVTIKAIDSGGLFDTQEVNIFVDDIPNASFVVHSIYDDAFLESFTDQSEPFIVSVEDPVVFDARATVDIVKPFSDSVMLYRWSNPDVGSNSHGFPSVFTINQSYFAIPPKPTANQNYGLINSRPVILTGPDPEAVYVDSIKNDHDLLDYRYDPVGFPGIQGTNILTLSLFLNGKPEGIPYRHEVYNAKCLPHRSPYPAMLFDDRIARFVDVPSRIDGAPDSPDNNPYLVNHTCCEMPAFNGNLIQAAQSWDYYGQDYVCYNFTDYGSYSEFLPGGSKNIPNLNFKTSDPQPNPVVSNTDTYERTIIGKCAPGRGNVCRLTTYSLKRTGLRTAIVGSGGIPFSSNINCDGTSGSALTNLLECNPDEIIFDTSELEEYGDGTLGGIFITEAIDAGNDEVIYEKIFFDKADSSEISVVDAPFFCFKINSSDSVSDLADGISPDFKGPHGTSENDDCYSSDSKILGHDGNRYMRIMVMMYGTYNQRIEYVSPSISRIKVTSRPGS